MKKIDGAAVEGTFATAGLALDGPMGLAIATVLSTTKAFTGKNLRINREAMTMGVFDVYYELTEDFDVRSRMNTTSLEELSELYEECRQRYIKTGDNYFREYMIRIEQRINNLMNERSEKSICTQK